MPRTGARRTPSAGTCDERAILGAFFREALVPRRRSNSPGDVCAARSHAYHKVLYCLRGSLVFRLAATGEEIALHPGDRLDIGPGTMHAAVVGPDGVTCIEAARG